MSSKVKYCALVSPVKASPSVGLDRLPLRLPPSRMDLTDTEGNCSTSFVALVFVRANAMGGCSLSATN